MATPYTHINLEDVEDVAPTHGYGDRWQARGARRALRAEQTGISHFRLSPGRRSPFVHRHERAEEVYVILGGSGVVKLDDTLLPVQEGDALRVAPRVARAFEAGRDGLTFLAVGAHHPGDGELIDDAWVA